MVFLLIATQAMLVAIVFFQGLEIRNLHQKFAELCGIVHDHHVALKPDLMTLYQTSKFPPRPKDYAND